MGDEELEIEDFIKTVKNYMLKIFNGYNYILHTLIYGEIHDIFLIDIKESILYFYTDDETTSKEFVDEVDFF